MSLVRASNASRPPLRRAISVLLALEEKKSVDPGHSFVATRSAATFSDDSKTASFGYKEVPKNEKKKLVGEVFSKVASKYDIMNDLMSGGLHRLWKDRLVSDLRPFPGMQHLDVAGGTGDVAFRVLDKIREAQGRVGYSATPPAEDAEDATRVVVCDINPQMLKVGQERAEAKGLGQLSPLEWLEGNAEELPISSNSMDAYTVAFGIRNVTNIDLALHEAYRVLKRGGRFMCLEFSHVSTPGLKPLYDLYSFQVIPVIGELVAGDRGSYQYLVESIRKFPVQGRFASMIENAGFQKVTYVDLAGGIVAIHSGYKL